MLLFPGLQYNGDQECGVPAHRAQIKKNRCSEEVLGQNLGVLKAVCGWPSLLFRQLQALPAIADEPGHQS